MRMKNRRYIFRLLTFWLCFFFSCQVSFVYAGNSLNKVAFIRPSEKFPFWNQAEKALRKAASDFEIELDVYTMDVDPYKFFQIAQEITESKNKPDLIIVSTIGNIGVSLIQMLDEAEIDVVVHFMGFSSQEHQKIGAPREKYKHWIASMLPDYHKTSQELASYLYEKAKKEHILSYWKVNMCLIHGVEGIGFSEKSVEGVLSLRDQYDDLVINEILPGYWSAENAQKVAFGHLIQHPETNAIWVINDPAAVGVVKAVESHGLIAGKDILIGSMNWLPEIFDYIRDGRVSVSVGGHFMDPAWLLLLAYDYHNGHDFEPYIGTEIESVFRIIDADNIDIYGDIIGNSPWEKIDFKQLSQTHNLDWAGYNFNLLDLLAPSSEKN